MFFTSMRNMYIGTNPETKKSIFIVANTVNDATDIADKYADESNIDGEFVITPIPSSIDALKAINFCEDSPLTATEEEINEYFNKPGIDRCESCGRLINHNRIAKNTAASDKGPGVSYKICPHCKGICGMRPE